MKTRHISVIIQKTFFDFIMIDECHRGGANDESS
ncbi:MAG: type I site-specific restriction endonuclease [Psychromonas sp.]|jgi:type I site-specific restriction endonuclease